MRTGVILPTTIPGTSAEQIAAWARSAEEKGFDSLRVVDRIVDDGHDRLGSLSIAASVTERVELVADVLIGPLDDGLTLAGRVESLDGVCGGRVTFGVGVRERHAGASGVDGWQSGLLLDANLAQLTGKSVLVCGPARHAARRIATRGSGWMMANGAPDQLAAGMIAIHHAWACAGRPGRPRCVAVFSVDPGGPTPDAVRAGLDAFERAGADDVLVAPCSADIAQLDLIARAALRAPALA
jgi:alkanesulfonate monooxygenase SsuD/methylene tetrahydromethanopterin reductase-like flavin-dependent oxidoreductase (luciferase family)